MKSKNANVKCYTYYRFSTPKQIKGDSLQRQLKLSEQYASERGWVLDDSLKIDDLGLSAYKGDNIKKGKLGAFLIAVEQGKVPAGSVLIVESLDRISRAKVLDALTIFLNIINNNITIITLADRMEYSKKSINEKSGIGQLMVSLGVMSRAHEESAIKSLRLKSSWHSKRQNIQNKKLTGRCPAWLYLDKEKNEFVEIIDRCELVKRIYNLSINGMGVGKIAKKFNEEKIPTWRSKNGWQHSYILKVLHNKSVLGEFHPTCVEDEQRQKVGEPIVNYFPQIISEEIFYRIQERLKDNAKFVGRSGEKNSNLVSGLAYCGYCNSKMQLVNKGKPPKSAKYLVCDYARRGIGCKYHSYRYDKFETALLSYCKGLDVNKLFTQNDDNSGLVLDLQSNIESTNGEISLLERKKSNLLSSLSDEDGKDLQLIIKNQMKLIMHKIDCLIDDRTKYTSDLNTIVHAFDNTKDNIIKTQELIDFFRSQDIAEIEKVRRKLRLQLRSLIERIDIYPAGSILEETYDENDNPVKVAEILSPRERDYSKYFVIYFKSGAARLITPTDHDKNDYIVKIEVDNGKYRTMYGSKNKKLVEIPNGECDKK